MPIYDELLKDCGNELKKHTEHNANLLYFPCIPIESFKDLGDFEPYTDEEIKMLLDYRGKEI